MSPPMVPLAVKVPLDLLEKLHERAANTNQVFSPYVRGLLQDRMQADERNEALMRLIESTDFEKNRSILIELLLLVRMLAGNERTKVVDGMLFKLGVEKWSVEDEK